MVRGKGVAFFTNICFICLVIFTNVSFALYGNDITLYIGYATCFLGVIGILLSKRMITKDELFIISLNFLYCVFLIVNSMYSTVSVNSPTTRGRLISTVIISVIMCSVVIFNDYDKRRWDRFFYVLCLVGIVSTLYTYSINDLIKGISGVLRLGEKLIGINSFGQYMSILCVFSLYKFLDNKKYRVLFFSSFILFFLFTSASGSRKAIVGCFIGAVLLFLFKSKRKKLLIILRVALIAGIILFIVSSYDFFGGIWERVSTIWSDSNSNVVESDAERKKMLFAALNGWLKSPVFGHGFNTFTSYNVFRTYAHNNYAEILFNTGIVGCLLHYIPRLFVTFNYWKQIKVREDLFAVMLFVLQVLLLVYDFAAVSYYYTMYNFVWWIAAAYMLKMKRDGTLSSKIKC